MDQIIDTSEPEHLDKEWKLRKIRVMRDALGISIVVLFIFLVFIFEVRLWVRTMLAILAALYAIYILYRLKNSLKQYYALTEDLVIKDGCIIKYSEKAGVELWKIPFDEVIKVYPNIKEMPNTLYILFRDEGDILGENFYKHRIKDKEKFVDILKKRNLIEEKSVSLEELKKLVKK